MRYLWMDEYMLKKPGVSKHFKEKWQWNCYQVGGKMFAAFCSDKEGEPVITLKCEPSHGVVLRGKYPHISPGYYMNKRHWISVRLESPVTDDFLRRLMDDSYRLVYDGLTKKARRLIEEDGGPATE